MTQFHVHQENSFANTWPHFVDTIRVRDAILGYPVNDSFGTNVGCLLEE